MTEPSLAAPPTAEPSPCTVLTRYGRMQVPSRDNDLIGRFLNIYGEWAMHEVRFVAGSLPPGAKVADVGAFVGTFSLGLMAETTLRSVCLVEANPAVAPLLRANLARNATVPAEVIEAVMVPASHQGALEASVEADNIGSFSVTMVAEDGREAATLAARQITLPELQNEHGLFDLIKLDVEGLETALLRDSLDAFATGETKFWLECSETESSIELCRIVLDAGMDVYYFAFPVFAVDNYNQSSEIVFPWAYEAGLWVTKGAAPHVAPEAAKVGCVLRRIRSTEELRQALWNTPRWSPPDWAGHDAPALAARAGHLLLGHRYDDFLTPGWRARPTSWSKPLVTVLEQQRDQLDSELVQARSLARASDVMLRAERTWMERQCRAFINDSEQAQATIARLQDEVSSRGEQLDAFRQAETGLRDQIVLLDQRSGTLGIIEGSTFYRVMLATRSLASRYPRPFRVMRPALAAGFRLLRRVAGRRGR